jgi:lipopolysaccharide transport system ATP-binding protein
MKPILEVQGISKKFKIQHVPGGYYNLRERMQNIFRFQKSTVEEFWALKDISFDVQPGESIGIIGRNGAGKSTLLKILSKITPPTTGRIVSRGRVASLLEVGTGFHPELTGKENIFFNGSLLGMKRKEIELKFDEIVDFSGVEKFLDTPLKHYSSGMQLRLAFAVAAHLEPEILIVDEVLAVGDSEFQKKCIRKMEDVTGQGRTVLFVSHNLSTLKSICTKGILLQDGRLNLTGTIEEAIDKYTSYNIEAETISSSLHYFQPHIKIHDFSINGGNTNAVSVEGTSLSLSMKIEFFKKSPFELDVHLKKEDSHIASYANFVRSYDKQVFDEGIYELSYQIELPDLRSGKYKLDLYFTEPFVSWYAISENIIDIEIINSTHHTFLTNHSLKWGSVLLNGDMTISKIG